MQSPVRLVALLRPSTSPALLAATAMSSIVFTATPFLLQSVSDHYGVSIGTASLISTAQLGGFVLASSFAGRRLSPTHRLLLGALAATIVVNALSAAAPSFALLLVLRVASGSALGVIAWIGWAEVFGDDERMGDIAVIGPVVGIVGAPLASVLADAAGEDAVFLTLALLAIAPMVLVRLQQRTTNPVPVSGSRRRSRPVPTAALILLCLGLFTLGGSAVFVFAAVIGTGTGLSPWLVSLAFSANAALGIPSARWRGARPLASLWLLGTAVAAVVVTTVDHRVAFFAAIAVWGFFFWAGVPGVFALLAQRSAHPADRAGDAQAVMALGRVFGPALGGVMIEAGSIELLGWVAGAMVAAAAITLAVVERVTAPLSG